MVGRVLVVDDVPQNVKLLEAKLTSEYYTVFSAYSGKEALAMVKDTAPDIILLDVMMPEMDGFEACRRLKNDPETSHIPVVMVTALSEMSDRIEGLNSGATDFITKPIDEVHLFARVKSLIRLKTMIDELRMRDQTTQNLGLSNNSALTLDQPVYGHILLVDDDIIQLRNMNEALANYGHSVVSISPSEVVPALQNNNFDLIVISTMLDDMDGLRLAVTIRSQEAMRQVPIMLLIDEDDKPLLVKALELGIDDYLMTPMDGNELIARCSTQIRRKRYQDMLKSSLQQSLSAAVVDSLTGLYNRRYLDSHLDSMFQESVERKAPLSLMSLDIDHFKLINDKPGWGHHIGDEILQQVGKRIVDSIRANDLATRPGGEEFVILMPNTSLEAAAAIAERARSMMESTPFRISAEPHEAVCTVSIGVSSINLGAPEDSPAELLKRADEALYEAKSNGRNRVVISGEVNAW